MRSIALKISPLAIRESIRANACDIAPVELSAWSTTNGSLSITVHAFHISHNSTIARNPTRSPPVKIKILSATMG